MAAYDTYVNADTYFAARLHVDAWDDATNSDKTKALTEGSSRIDRLQFRGSKVLETQDLEFPRYYGDEADGTETVPDDIKIACYEVAFALLEDIDIDYDPSVTGRVFADVRTTYDRMSPQAHLLAGIPSVYAWKFLQPYFARAKSIKTYRVN